MSRLWPWVCLVLIGCATPPPRYALVVGIDDYRAPGIAPLAGARNDARAVANLLRTRFGFEHVRLVEDATRAQLVAGLDALVAKARPGAQLVFHFSGHGAQVRDRDGDEPDQWDEALVPADSGRIGSRNDLTDDDLARYAARAAEAGAELTVILDSCHSGTGLRDGQPVRAAPPVGDVDVEPAGGVVSDGSAPTPYALITAAAAGERAREVILPDGRHHGALTWALVRALQSAAPSATWREVMARVRFALAGQFPNQRPQLEGEGADRVVFGQRERPTSPGFTLRQVGDEIRLAAGSAQGVAEGAELSVLADGETVGTLRITAATPWTARATLASGRLPPGAHARLVATPAPATQLRVHVPPALRPLRDAVDDHGQLRVVGPGEGPLTIDRLDDGRLALRVGSQRRGAPVADDAAGHATLVERLRHWARWHALHDLRSLDRMPVHFALEGPRPIRDGDTVHLVVRNQGRRALYLGILGLTDAGEIGVLYPAPGAEEQIAAGAEWRRPIVASGPSRDVLKLVATTEPFDLSPLSVDAVRGGPLPGGHPLGGWLRAVTLGTRDGPSTLRANTWAVRELLVEVFPPAP